MPDGALKDLLVDGVIGGVGSVIVFLPNIMILYLFIACMAFSYTHLNGGKTYKRQCRRNDSDFHKT